MFDRFLSRFFIKSVKRNAVTVISDRRESACILYEFKSEEFWNNRGREFAKKYSATR